MRGTLKGKAEGEHIKVLHFKFGEVRKGFEGRGTYDGPQLVKFRPGPVTVGAGPSKRVVAKPEYLLFLKKMKDGRYEPVSGQIDPVDSIRMVSPLDNDPDR